MQMYRQIWMEALDRDYQRIIWQSAPDQPLSHYCINTVTFGVSSAPFLAMRVLQQLLLDDGDQFPLARSLQTGMYDDDCLFGADDKHTAIKLRKEVEELLRGGGFILRKWASNSAELLSEVSAENHGLAWDPSRDCDNHLKILGVIWNPLKDSFQFQVNLTKITSYTKRSLLSQIVRLYDPLGWVSPVIIPAKTLMESLWKLELGWDDPLPQKLVACWQVITKDLYNLQAFSITRWIGSGVDDVSYELHGFSHASSLAFAAVAYSKITLSNGEVVISLLMSKTKVAPIKQLSITRLELNAALLLSRILSFLGSQSQFASFSQYCWTNASIVFAWLAQEPCKWKTFVGNRVSEIQTQSPFAQWRHVPSQDNPADLASRGVSARELIQSNLWQRGPRWLSLPPKHWLRPERPFLHSGVDYAGPIQIRYRSGRGAKTHPAYISLFVCFATKAIHLELVSNYTTDAFVAAFKRFISRRGIPTDLYSDRGTNFRGADTELRKSYNDAIHSSEFRTQLAKDCISWHFLPPAAPHFGGLWEAGVRGAKYHLKRVLRDHSPTRRSR